MSILIKGTEMPETCFECPFMFSRRYRCANLTLDFYGDDGEYTELKGRVDGCPLVELPPHGRLIDANSIYDAVEQRYRMSSGIEHRCERDLLDLICSAPTIIPAEEETDNG